jgi:acyl dehydratase
MARFATVGEECTRVVELTPDGIARFATLAGDENPLHHDEAHARATRFGGLIASGTQPVALLMGLAATYFSRDAAALGLDFSFRLRKAAHAGDALLLRWRVARVQPKEKLAGELVSLEGEVRNGAGEIAVVATATLLLTARL